MASRFIILSVTAWLLFGAGCSKNRGWLSRNDYSEMQDPFMEPDGSVAKSNDRSSKAAGRASLDDSEPEVANAEGRARVPGTRMTLPGMTGPKPIRPAGSSNGMTENGRHATPATYPEEFADGAPANDGTRTAETGGVKSYSGPALSDFLQKRNAAAREAAMAAEQLPSRPGSSANAAAQNALNPAAVRTAQPTLSPEVESFSNFLTDTSGNVANTTQKANQQVQETATDANDFVSWAEQEKAANLKKANAARSRVSAAPAQARKEAGTVFQQARQASQEMADSMLEPEFDDVSDDAAVPLINRRSAPSAAPTLSKAKAPAANDFTAEENPFADSFEEFHSSGSTATQGISQRPSATSATARSSSAPHSLDDNFRRDTGWKPAHMTRP
ncbi:MAG: hypothetical protein H7Z17_08525 [Fuerstia sp.]|nr:hypothetical protein [Fuerstiella sp.]